MIPYEDFVNSSSPSSPPRLRPFQIVGDKIDGLKPRRRITINRPPMEFICALCNEKIVFRVEPRRQPRNRARTGQFVPRNRLYDHECIQCKTLVCRRCDDRTDFLKWVEVGGVDTYLCRPCRSTGSESEHGGDSATTADNAYTHTPTAPTSSNPDSRPSTTPRGS